jgi:hypothetical protein
VTFEVIEELVRKWIIRGGSLNDVEDDRKIVKGMRWRSV